MDPVDEGELYQRLVEHQKQKSDLIPESNDLQETKIDSLHSNFAEQDQKEKPRTQQSPDDEPQQASDSYPTAHNFILQQVAPPPFPYIYSSQLTSFPNIVAAEPSFKAPPVAPCRTLNDREKFFLFVKLLLRFLEKVDARLVGRVKAVVAECTMRNRQGHVDFIPLVETTERRLQGVVGDRYYLQAKSCLESHLLRQRRKLADEMSNIPEPTPV
jgi:hypothetical protein